MGLAPKERESDDQGANQELDCDVCVEIATPTTGGCLKAPAPAS